MTPKLTDKASEALELAHEAASELGHGYVGSEHLLLGLIRQKAGAATVILRESGVTEQAVIRQLTETVGRGEAGQPLLQGLTPRSRRVIDMAASEAGRLGQSFIGTEHLLMGLLHDGDSMAAQLLTALGTEPRKLYTALVDGLYRKSGASVEPPRFAPSPKIVKKTDTLGEPRSLGRYGQDLTEAARRRQLDPVIGRERETERVMQILSRRRKNNPVLLGEPGTGKTAVAEGLAQRIADGDVPEELAGRRVISLDISAMVAGTKYRGEFEERFKQVLEDIMAAGDVLLFIDELHTVVGAGAAEGAIDAANILKPALARGRLRVIGATTPEEYRRHIERDAALERRFQPVAVEPPDAKTSLKILIGLRGAYEAHHHVRVNDEAIAAAVRLSVRYIPNRFLPDKAIDLIDEACARRRMAGLTPPPELQAAEEELKRLGMEKDAAIARKDLSAAAALKECIMTAEAAQRDRIHEWKADSHEGLGDISGEDVAAVVADWTGIPTARLTEDEAERLLRLEERLHARMVGQNEAVAAVTRAVRRGRVGLGDPRRPVGSFLFLGPSGVGKTELCRALAEAQFGSEDALIRVDMSEMMERHAGAKLIGAPPGYVGYGESGGLTEQVRRRPFSVVLLDEIEKAHPDVLNLLLQLLEDGRLTDSSGRVADFRNTIVVMTANIGARQLVNARPLGFSLGDTTEEKRRAAVLEELRHTLSPELLGRIDEVILFRTLTQDELLVIARRLVEPLERRLAERGVTLTVEPRALEKLAERDDGRQAYGARPLRRRIRTELEDRLTMALLEQPGAKALAVGLDDSGELAVRVEND